LSCGATTQSFLTWLSIISERDLNKQGGDSFSKAKKNIGININLINFVIVALIPVNLHCLPLHVRCTVLCAAESMVLKFAAEQTKYWNQAPFGILKGRKYAEEFESQ
jgi:hypothetical protein